MEATCTVVSRNYNQSLLDDSLPRKSHYDIVNFCPSACLRFSVNKVLFTSLQSHQLVKCSAFNITDCETKLPFPLVAFKIHLIGFEINNCSEMLEEARKVTTIPFL